MRHLKHNYWVSSLCCSCLELWWNSGFCTSGIQVELKRIKLKLHESQTAIISINPSLLLFNQLTADGPLSPAFFDFSLRFSAANPDSHGVICQTVILKVSESWQESQVELPHKHGNNRIADKRGKKTQNPTKPVCERRQKENGNAS